MVEHADLLAVVHKTAQTSKELAAVLQEEIVKNEPTGVTIDLGIGTAHMIATQLRVTANLVEGLIKENSYMIERITELVERTKN